MEEGPRRTPHLRSLHLVLLLQGIDAVFALRVGFRGFGVIVAAAHHIGYFLPLLLPEVSAAEFEVSFAPRIDEHGGRAFAPAIVAAAGGGGGGAERGLDGEGESEDLMGRGGGDGDRI